MQHDRCPRLASTRARAGPQPQPARPRTQVYRTFCFVEDACEAVMKVIAHPDKSSGHCFNVGNPGNNIQVKELAALMIDM